MFKASSLSKRPLGFESFSGNKCLLGLSAFHQNARRGRAQQQALEQRQYCSVSSDETSQPLFPQVLFVSVSLLLSYYFDKGHESTSSPRGH